jgi:hypothetical protein
VAASDAIPIVRRQRIPAHGRSKHAESRSDEDDFMTLKTSIERKMENRR